MDYRSYSGYGPRQSQIPGPSRAPAYDRDIREIRDGRYDHYAPPPPPQLRRQSDSQLAYKPGDFIHVQSPREFHNEPWNPEGPSWDYAPGPPNSIRPPSPPPPFTQPSYGNYGHRPYSPRMSNSQPPTPNWDDRRIWDKPRPEDRHVPPPTFWRPYNRDPPGSRIHSLLNPSPVSPGNTDRSWRPAQDPGYVPQQGRDSYRPFQGSHAEERYSGFDRHPSANYYHERLPHEADTYRPSYEERVPRVASTYRPGQQRPSRPSALGDYKRQRPPAAPPYVRQERNRSISGPDRTISSNGSQAGYSPIADSDTRGRYVHSQSLTHQENRRSPRRGNFYRPSQNDSDSDVGSDDESEIASSRSGESSRSSSFSDNESTRKTVVKPTVDGGRGAEAKPTSSGESTSAVRAREKSGVMSVHQLISPSPSHATPIITDNKGESRPPALTIQDSLDTDLRESFPSSQASQTKQSNELDVIKESGKEPIAVVPAVARIIAQGIAPSRTSTPIGFTTSISSERSVVLDLSHTFTPVTRTPEPSVTSISNEATGAQVPEQPPIAVDSVITAEKQVTEVRVVDSPVKRARTPPPDDEAIIRTLRKAIQARQQFSRQTREQRVNPILISNLSKVDPRPKREATGPDDLIKEVLSRILPGDEDEDQLNVRSQLAANFAEQREFLAEKTQRLRDEYMELQERWLMHCAGLDCTVKATVMEETTSVMGRTTRRSAATLGDAVRSDLEMEQILATLGNEDLTDPHHLAVRNIAVIPDMISVENGEVDYLFDDTNGLVEDPATYYDARTGFYDWTPEEEQIFLSKYADYPKQFGAIASFLPHKTQAQCVLYYYIHKKRLVDFRTAVNLNTGKRKKGVRRGGKQKGNALLADIQQTDSQKPPGRRRRGRPPANPEAKAAAAAAAAAARQVDGEVNSNGDGEARPKRRKTLNSAIAMNKLIMANEMELGSDGTPMVDAEGSSQAPAVPKKRRGRKPKVPRVEGLPGEFIETKFVEENINKRKHGVSSQWTDGDRDDFLKLLARHGKNFRQIASEMNNKTTVQVSNYYKSHLYDLNLDKIASTASEQSFEGVRDGGIASLPILSNRQSSSASTPSEERDSSANPAGDGRHSDPQVVEAEAGVHVLSLKEPPESIWVAETAYSNGSRDPSGPSMQSKLPMRQHTQKPFMSVLHPSSFQSSENGRPRGMLMSSHTPQPFPSPMPAMMNGMGHIMHHHGHPVSYEFTPDQGQHSDVQGAGDWPVPPPFPGLPSRFTSFRAQMPSAMAAAGEKRSPVAIQPAPPYQRPDLAFYGYPLAYPPGVPVGAPYFAPGGQMPHAEQGAVKNNVLHPMSGSAGLDRGSNSQSPAMQPDASRKRSDSHQQ